MTEVAHQVARDCLVSIQAHGQGAAHSDAGEHHAEEERCIGGRGAALCHDAMMTRSHPGG